MNNLQDRNNQAIMQAINELNRKLSSINKELSILSKNNAKQEMEIKQLKTQLAIALASSRGTGATSGN